MELLKSLDELAAPGRQREKVVLTIGAFDGVHIAHQALISEAAKRARELEALAVVLSFDPHPDFIVRPNPPPMLYLSNLEDKADLIKALGVDILIVQPFTLEFARHTAQEFLGKLLALMDIKEIWVGKDFVFGHKAQGNVAFLREAGRRFGFNLVPLEPVELEREIVSSTRVRNLLASGAIEEANRVLGRFFSLKGNVVEGNKRGRLIGFPTANLALPANFSVPANGVYATRTTIFGLESEGFPRPSVTNVGVRPTFDNGERSVETFILDYTGDLYGKEIRVEFIRRLRDERKFAGIDEIRQQLGRDVEKAREVLQATREQLK